MLDIRTILSRFILLPIAKTYSRRNYFKAIKYQRYLEKTQFFKREEINEIRNKKFRELIYHCYHNVPFYRRYMDKNNLRVVDFQSIKDIRKFPLMTKKILNKNYASLRAENYKDKMVRQESTGNTTGEPVNFLRDLTNEYIVDANNWRFQKFVGYLKGMQTALFWGNVLELVNIDCRKERLKDFVNNTKVLNFFNLTPASLDQYIGYMQKSKPEIIRGYATGIYLFVQYCNQKNICLNYRPKFIILTSDKIYEPQKIKIKKFFNCELFEEYGCREFSFLAYECPIHKGMHLAEEIFIFETLDTNTNEVKFEGRGEIVVTPLHNYAMPLLRYRLEDEVTISSEYCSCGRTLKLISNIEGKITDFVITKSGKLIWGSLFASIIYSFNGINLYQVTQEKIGKVKINIIKNEHFDEKKMSILKNKFADICQDDLDIEFKSVKEIKIPSSGKRRSVISNIAKEYIPK